MLRLVILAFLSVTLWIVYARPVRTQQDDRSIPITITGQPEAVNGIVPIEIKCGPAHLSAPNSLDRFNCSLKNNSAQSVTAANVVYSVILDTIAGTTTQAYNRTFDALVHPDFKLSKQFDLFADGIEVECLDVEIDDVCESENRTEPLRIFGEIKCKYVAFRRKLRQNIQHRPIGKSVFG